MSIPLILTYDNIITAIIFIRHKNIENVMLVGLATQTSTYMYCDNRVTSVNTYT